MGELNRYTQMMRENRLRKLASIIIEQRLDLNKIINEFAGFAALQGMGSQSEEDQWRSNLAHQAAADHQGYLAHWRAGHEEEMKRRAAEEAAAKPKPKEPDVHALASQLGSLLKNFGYSEEDIDKMVKHALDKRLTPKPIEPINVGLGVGMDKNTAAQSGTFSTHTSADVSPELGGSQSFDTHSSGDVNTHSSGDVNQSDSDIAAGKKPGDHKLTPDHHERTGAILNDWCFLAGIEKDGRKGK
jgi:hypothetical protein